MRPARLTLSIRPHSLSPGLHWTFRNCLQISTSTALNKSGGLGSSSRALQDTKHHENRQAHASGLRLTSVARFKSSIGTGALRSTNSSSLTLVGIFCVGLGIGVSIIYQSKAAFESNGQNNTLDAVGEEDMASTTPPGAASGRPSNLTADQEEKLRRLWQLIFQVGGIDGEDVAIPSVANGKSEESDHKKPKKKKISLFSRKGKKDSDIETVAAPSSSPRLSPKENEEDKYGQTQVFQDTLASQSPESIREMIWSVFKHDHPDALLLRYLRARKWDVEKALVMLVSTLNWRHSEMHVDDDIMKNGEGAALAAEKSSDTAELKKGQEFLAQIRMGKSFLHGVDREGRPICVVRVRLHKQGEQAEESLERYTVFLIETCRLLLPHPVDTATVVFDMTGFSLSNMDYTPVKFMIKCFEANYPESLGAVLVHRAPWIFQGVWKVIKAWLDPVVANKVHFTNNVKEMEEYIPRNHIIKELDGDEDWEYQYVETVPGENDKMNDTDAKNRLLAARADLHRQFEQATSEWLRCQQGEERSQAQTKRNALAAKLRENYWSLDPYIRARSYYDRTGVLQAGGKLDFYPTPNGVGKGRPPSTSADDVD